jgi:hypothetical protein
MDHRTDFANAQQTSDGSASGGTRTPNRLIRSLNSACPSSVNTVQLGLRMVVVGGPVGLGQWRWCERLTCQRVYLRLTTRGLAR